MREIGAKKEYQKTVNSLPDENRESQNRAIWNAALGWAAENARIECIAEGTGETIEAEIESTDWCDEIYRINKSTILDGRQ